MAATRAALLITGSPGAWGVFYVIESTRQVFYRPTGDESLARIREAVAAKRDPFLAFGWQEGAHLVPYIGAIKDVLYVER